MRICAVCLLAILLVATVPVMATELPPGFAETDLFPPFSLPGPISLDFAPDGGIWLAVSGPGEGMHVWVKRGAVSTNALNFPWTPTGERGIHAIAVDPDYAVNNYIWLYYTHMDPPAHNRLSRWTNVNDTLQNEQVILYGPTLSTESHNGGCLAFADDGTLFLGMGDDSAAAPPRNLFELRGKILHMNTDGSGAWDNPYLDGTAGNPLVWANGVRNPFRCNIQPGAGNLFFGDVQGGAGEEINIGLAGADFGWALIEGSVPAGMPGFTYPIYDFPHEGFSTAVIGGDHATAVMFPPEYEGDYFFVEWYTGVIYRMQLDASNNPTSVEPWGDSEGRVVQLKFGPDGAMYYVARGAVQNVRRIEYVGGANRQPDAISIATPDSGAAALSVALDGTGSTDPDDDTLTYSWDLGDGTFDTGATVNKVYPQGVYYAVLTVDDGNGLSDVSQPLRIVSGNSRPAATVLTPLPTLTYDAGDTVSYSGSLSDPEDGSLTCPSNSGQYSWQVLFHHGTHTHPFIGPEQGACSGSFQVPTQGETSPNTWYEVRMIGSDLGTPIGAGGELTGESSVHVYPNLTTLSLETLPPGLAVTLDGQTTPTPANIQSVVNMTRTLGPIDDQPQGAHAYSWLSWSDGGARDHQISAPAVTTIYTATYGCDVIAEAGNLRVDVEWTTEEVTLDWDPIVDSCFSADPDRYRIYESDSSRPLSGSGSFPADPGFVQVGTSFNEQFVYTPAPGLKYFLVVGKGTDLKDGAAGHYE